MKRMSRIKCDGGKHSGRQAKAATLERTDQKKLILNEKIPCIWFDCAFSKKASDGSVNGQSGNRINS